MLLSRTERAGQPLRDYLGASVLGDPCDRRLAYQYAGVAPDLPTGRNIRIFEAGHALQALMSRWLRLAGFDLIDVDPNTGREFEFSIAGDRVRGHADGIIGKGPHIGACYPLLWEAKALNSAAWSDLTMRGLRPAKPGYFAQVQVYLYEFDLAACLFTALNKDSAGLYHELVPIEEGFGEWLVARGIAIADLVDRGAIPARIDDRRACRGCPYHAHCYGAELSLYRRAEEPAAAE